jgi:hypothetical protein
VGFNPGAVHVDFTATTTQAANGRRFENLASAASVISALNPAPASSTEPNATSINDRGQGATEHSLPHDPSGFALLGCVLAVFAVQLYRLRLNSL